MRGGREREAVFAQQLMSLSDAKAETGCTKAVPAGGNGINGPLKATVLRMSANATSERVDLEA